MMTTDKSIGLYIHIPFCLKKCSYCDFSSYAGVSYDIRKKYIDALCSEIFKYKKQDLNIDSIFLGGGTPSLLTLDELSAIFESIYESFAVYPSSEITLEANPGTLDEEKVSRYADLGINRMSIGCQSLCDRELRALGRIHTAENFYTSYSIARDAGISNVNIDIMYGIPDQTLESFNFTLDKILELSPEHISMYGLILEPGTEFWESKNMLKLPSEDEEIEMYYLASKKLKDAGYSHYEISNYAKEKYKCKHNLKYWRCEDYIGVGLSAHSCFNKKRFLNPSTFDKYFSSLDAEYIIDEVLDSETFEYEYAMMRLRLSGGISLRDYKNLFGRSFLLGREEKIDLYEKLGYIRFDKDRIALTESGFYVSNAILSELL